MLKNRLLKKQRLKKKVSSSSTVSGKKKNKSSFPKKNKNKKLSSSGSLVKKGGSGKAKKAAPGKNKKASFSLKQKEKKQRSASASKRKKEKKSPAKLSSSTSKNTKETKTTSQKNTLRNKKKDKTPKTAPSKKTSSIDTNKKVKPSPQETKKEKKRSTPSRVSKKETIPAKKKKTKTFNENDIIEEPLPSQTVEEEEMEDEEVNVDIDPSVLVGEDAQVTTDDDEEDEESPYIPKKSTPSMIKGKVRPLFEEKNIPKPKWTPPKEEVKKPIQKKEDNRTRYSDEELAEFKAIILQKLEEARSNYQELKAALTHSDAHGTEDTHATFKLMEDGSETMTREEIAQLAARQEKFIKNLENALIRIENKTYGICRVTGKLIPKERLRLVPHATLSIEAKEKLNR